MNTSRQTQTILVDQATDSAIRRLAERYHIEPRLVVSRAVEALQESCAEKESEIKGGTSCR